MLGREREKGVRTSDPAVFQDGYSHITPAGGDSDYGQLKSPDMGRNSILDVAWLQNAQRGATGRCHKKMQAKQERLSIQKSQFKPG